MSDVFDPKHLYAIIRKPQEGKTFICLENISQNDEYVHFVLTMNTIKSSRQFFQRKSIKIMLYLFLKIEYYING